jgi:4-aminobutyrate aminotransferase-like enzyme
LPIPAPSPANYPGGIAQGFAAAVTAACATMRDQGIRPALLIVDTVFSSDGLWLDPPGFLAPAVAAIRAEGGLFLADEVQPGFGRTGGQMWGFQRHGLVPDMVSMGKPMGNGYPVAALALRPDVIAEFGTQGALFQHLRRQRRGRCHGHGRPRRDPRRGPDGQRRPRRPRLPRRASRRCPAR